MRWTERLLASRRRRKELEAAETPGQGAKGLAVEGHAPQGMAATGSGRGSVLLGRLSALAHKGGLGQRAAPAAPVEPAPPARPEAQAQRSGSSAQPWPPAAGAPTRPNMAPAAFDAAGPITAPSSASAAAPPGAVGDREAAGSEDEAAAASSSEATETLEESSVAKVHVDSMTAVPEDLFRDMLRAGDAARYRGQHLLRKDFSDYSSRAHRMEPRRRRQHLVRTDGEPPEAIEAGY